MCKIQIHSSVFAVPLHVFISGLKQCACADYQGSVNAVWCVDSVCPCVRVYVCTSLCVLGRLEVLVRLIEKDHLSEKLKQWQIILKHKHTHTHGNRSRLTHSHTEMCRLILFLFSSSLSRPLSFSSSTLSPIFINPLLWCLASCPCALSVVDWP